MSISVLVIRRHQRNKSTLVRPRTSGLLRTHMDQETTSLSGGGEVDANITRTYVRVPSACVHRAPANVSSTLR